jgi:dihydroorotase
MTHDVVIAGGMLVGPAEPLRADLGITGGVIAGIGAPGAIRGHSRIDAKDLLVLPGAIDMHVHFREPGLERKEDFWHGTRAAAAGGVTLVADMPNTLPAVTDATVLADKNERLRGNAWVDVALWAGGTQVAEFAAMQDAGAIGLKVYMTRPRRADDPYSDDLSMPDAETFRDVLTESARLDWPVAVHVCDPDQEDTEHARLRRIADDDARLVCRSLRGPGVVDALRLVLELAEQSGARVHVAHISLAPTDAVDVVRQARLSGSTVTCELPPPALSERELARLGTRGTPFAFPDGECEFFWQAIADGTIDCIASDHAPHTVEDKLVDAPSVWSAPPGYPGVETLLPLMLDATLTGRLSFTRLVDATAAGPARILGVPRKGALRIGNDADLVLVDPAGTSRIDESRLHSKAGWSPFHGRQLSGRIVATLLRGAVIARDGEIVADRPSGLRASAAPLERHSS